MSGRYTVDLNALSVFIDRLSAFTARAEQVAEAVDRRSTQLQVTWQGDGATAHQDYHEIWMDAMARMQDGIDELRHAAHVAHNNYTTAVRANTAMWPQS